MEGILIIHSSSGRSDLSFTISLTDKSTYEEEAEEMNSEKEFKQCGEIIIYPSTYLHSVKEIKGERLVCIGWIESYVSQLKSICLILMQVQRLLAKNGRSMN